ncbi:putative DNA-binding transcriptional regulator [Zunongwangia sp. SCSIO 43204]|uniref:YfeC-like transcriptional regulator n=1 Tax=Zunongwangia sp. SCSIO 43204 TaxID=2779359 RepID=UPI001CA9A5E3|nr:YfeC-like transcriptional regulator [Zunongwangia sp. SCSIO 43204]UAB84983.1 putative DNA-binding transcriptional regulator [Zunongwangia sp. SCSIO 43204]
MARTESMQRKYDHAKLLYTVEGVTVQKELAERVGTTPQTINKWIKDEAWENLRASVIITKDAELHRFYMQITELNDSIMNRPKGQRFANSKEADALVKLTGAVRQLETDTSVADTIEVLKNFINHIRQDDYEKAKEVTNLADIFIKSIIK